MSEPRARFGFLGVLREMAWAFLGVRDRANYERSTRSNPVHIILAGILLTALLVLALVGAVKFALSDRPTGGASANAGQVVVDQQGSK
ncbi:MAG: DUF2970 domain-containing protein [Immundisolibacter sp.]|uniref:DUF2970 domain-containing protein n=1 Tax=Immundisolibacter sp. TaxID=1934948 RepID=UPI003D0E0B48